MTAKGLRVVCHLLPPVVGAQRFSYLLYYLLSELGARDGGADAGAPAAAVPNLLLI